MMNRHQASAPKAVASSEPYTHLGDGWFVLQPDATVGPEGAAFE
jgi:hypothetical protein